METAVLAPIDEATLGPAMLALTPLQRRYVRAIQLIGDGNHTRACALAGYAGNNDVMRQNGYANSHNPKIGAALVEEGIFIFQTAVNEAVANVIDVNRNPGQKEAKMKLKVALAILDRNGLGVTTTQNIRVKDERTENMAQMVNELRLLIDRNPAMLEFVPAPMRKLIAAPKKEAVDVEFTEVVARDPDADLLGE